MRAEPRSLLGMEKQLVCADHMDERYHNQLRASPHRGNCADCGAWVRGVGNTDQGFDRPELCRACAETADLCEWCRSPLRFNPLTWRRALEAEFAGAVARHGGSPAALPRAAFRAYLLERGCVAQHVDRFMRVRRLQRQRTYGNRRRVRA